MMLCFESGLCQKKLLALEDAAHSFDCTFVFARNFGVSRAGRGTCDSAAAPDGLKPSSGIAIPAPVLPWSISCLSGYAGKTAKMIMTAGYIF